ncbi:MAG: hypothetical protein LIP03_01425 [Bacteroidales bacterium]|nr:hypothetical protein [Bacteroidales bacterium]
MDIKIIRDALIEAQHLIGEEYQSLCDEELASQYDKTLKLISAALKEIENTQDRSANPR